MYGWSGMGDLTLDQWKGLLPAVQCPAGYSTAAVAQMAAAGQINNWTTPPLASDVCLNPTGYRENQIAKFAADKSVSNQGFMMLAGALGVLVFAPGMLKLAAAPLAYFGILRAI